MRCQTLPPNQCGGHHLQKLKNVNEINSFSSIPRFFQPSSPPIYLPLLIYMSFSSLFYLPFDVSPLLPPNFVTHDLLFTRYLISTPFLHELKYLLLSLPHALNLPPKDHLVFPDVFWYLYLLFSPSSLFPISRHN